MRPFRFWLLVALLAGCTSVPPAPPRPDPESISTFAFNGRIAVRQGEQRHSANIDWRHSAARDEVLLATPLGQGIAKIVREASGAHLTLADRRSFAAADWNELSAEVLGFHLPLDAATRWLLGTTGDAAGWRVRVLEREGDLPNALPRLLEFERDDIAVRLWIDEWREVE